MGSLLSWNQNQLNTKILSAPALRYMLQPKESKKVRGKKCKNNTNLKVTQTKS